MAGYNVILSQGAQYDISLGQNVISQNQDRTGTKRRFPKSEQDRDKRSFAKHQDRTGTKCHSPKIWVKMSFSKNWDKSQTLCPNANNPL